MDDIWGDDGGRFEPPAGEPVGGRFSSSSSQSFTGGGQANWAGVVSHGVRALSPLISGIVEALRGSEPDALRELQIREACLRIEQLQGRATVLKAAPVLEALGAGWMDEDGQLCWARRDVLIFGTRGSGKSASSAVIGQLAQALGEKVYTKGMPSKVSEALGFEATNTKLCDLKDCVVLVEEAGLAFGSSRKRDDQLEQALALARHNGISIVWNAQNTAQIQRSILRHEAALCFKQVDPFAALFEREEVGDLMQQVIALQTQYPAETPGRTLVASGGQWFQTELPLPDGWTERISIMHR